MWFRNELSSLPEVSLYLNISLPFTPRSSKWSVSKQRHFKIFFPVYATCSVHLVPLDLSSSQCLLSSANQEATQYAVLFSLLLLASSLGPDISLGSLSSGTPSLTPDRCWQRREIHRRSNTPDTNSPDTHKQLKLRWNLITVLGF